jgi:hypothetical protein
MKRLLGVLQIAQVLALRLETLGAEDVSEFEARLRSRYGGSESTRPLWETLVGSAVFDRLGWQRLSNFDLPVPVVLLIDDLNGMSGVVLRDRDRLVELLSETELFVFYVTDTDTTFVVAFNDHDVLICAGEASTWIE